MATVKIVEDEFGTVTQPITLEIQSVKRFTFTNENGVSIQVKINKKKPSSKETTN